MRILNRYRWYCLYGDIWIENDKRMCDVIVRKKKHHRNQNGNVCAHAPVARRLCARTQHCKEMTPQRMMIRCRDNFQSHIVLRRVKRNLIKHDWNMEENNSHMRTTQSVRESERDVRVCDMSELQCMLTMCI